MNKKIFALLVPLLLVGCGTGSGIRTDESGNVFRVSTNAAIQSEVSEFQEMCVVKVSELAMQISTSYWESIENESVPQSEVGEVAREFRKLGEATARTHPTYRDFGAEIIAQGLKICGDQDSYFDMKMDRQRSRHEMITKVSGQIFGLIKAIAPWYAGYKIAEELSDWNQTNISVNGEYTPGTRNETNSTVIENIGVE